MPVYKAIAYKRWDPEKRSVITIRVRAKNPGDAALKLAHRDLVDVKLERIRGLKGLFASWRAEIK